VFREEAVGRKVVWKEVVGDRVVWEVVAGRGSGVGLEIRTCRGRLHLSLVGPSSSHRCANDQT